MMIQALRSFCFDGMAYVLTGLFIIFCTLVFPFLSHLKRFYLYQSFMKFLLWLAKTVLGLKYQVLDKQYLEETAKNGPCILACKHQSVWETLVVSIFLKDFTIVLKKELKNIPLYGLFLKNLDMIFIDRQARSQAVKNLIIQGRQAFKAKKSIIIFPEGTRSIPGTVTTYHPGIALLYQDLKIPVVPIALNSGLFWGRRSMVKKSGLITLQFLPPIQPGLDRNEFMNRLQDNLETACQKLNESVQKTD